MALSVLLTACGGDSLKLLVAPAATEAPRSDPGAAGRSDVAQLTPQSPLATSSAAASVVPTPQAGKGSLTGRLIRFNTGQPMINQNLSLPAVLCPPGVLEKDKREQCVYVMDDAFDPSTLSDGEGRFIFRDVAAGEYVLMIGNRMTKYTILANEFNQPLIWKVEAGKVLELGDLVVDLR
jgi:hypothetical protein